MKQILSTSKAPAAIGAYSQAVVSNGMLFASGQLGIDPATGEFAGNDFRSQAEQAIKNVAAILEAAGTDASHVIKTTVFLTDMSNFAILNEVYSTLLSTLCTIHNHELNGLDIVQALLVICCRCA